MIAKWPKKAKNMPKIQQLFVEKGVYF